MGNQIKCKITQYKLIIKGEVHNKCINLRECPKQIGIKEKQATVLFSFVKTDLDV